VSEQVCDRSELNTSDDATSCQPLATRRIIAGRWQKQNRLTQVCSQRNRSVVYINMLAVSGGTGRGRTGPGRFGSGTGMKINSRERRAERTLIWVFLAFVVLWLPFFCANLTYGR